MSQGGSEHIYILFLPAFTFSPLDLISHVLFLSFQCRRRATFGPGGAALPWRPTANVFLVKITSLLNSLPSLHFFKNFTSIHRSTSLSTGHSPPPPPSQQPPPSLWTATLRRGFVGCVRDLVLNGRTVDIASHAKRQDSGQFSI